jgi:hypothetical protein
MMMRIADGIASRHHCQALITGESLGQVASQTLEAINCTDPVASRPVFRPLIGMDKDDTVQIARRIGTYETSILPYEDCCTIFVAKHPRTRPSLPRSKLRKQGLICRLWLKQAWRELKRYIMKTGKLSHQDLKRIVLDRLPEPANTVTSGPAVGLDCAAIRFGDGQVILSSDPITGAAADVGRLAVHISCNDIAACGIRPSALMIVIIAPVSASADDIQLVIDQASATARKLNVSIIGGHTEVSSAVSRFVITTTALGFTYGGHIIQSSGGRAGDTILMSKTAALEGTAILAADLGTA